MESAKELDIFEALVPFTLIIFTIAIGVVLMVQQFRKSFLKQLLEKEELKLKHQQELLQSILHTQEKERKRIAREMHDELGATLSIARMNIVQFESHLKQRNEPVEAVKNIKFLLDTAISDMRNLSHQLMPLHLERGGLSQSIQMLIGKIQDNKLMDVEYTYLEPAIELNWMQSLIIYRIVQELINNTLKHAGADKIKLNIYCMTNVLHVLYADNGKGYDFNEHVNGFGLTNVNQRVQSLNGDIQIETNLNKGFKCSIKVPLTNEKN